MYNSYYNLVGVYSKNCFKKMVKNSRYTKTKVIWSWFIMFLASTFDSGYWLFTVSRFQDTCPFFHRKGFSLKKLSCRMCRSFWRIQCKSNWMSCTMLCAIIKNDRTALDRSLVFTRIRLWWLEWGDVHEHVVKIQAIYFFFWFGCIRIIFQDFSAMLGKKTSTWC